MMLHVLVQVGCRLGADARYDVIPPLLRALGGNVHSFTIARNHVSAVLIAARGQAIEDVPQAFCDELQRQLGSEYRCVLQPPGAGYYGDSDS